MGGWVSSVFVLLSSIILDCWYVVRRSVGGWVSSVWCIGWQIYFQNALLIQDRNYKGCKIKCNLIRQDTFSINYLVQVYDKTN